MTTLSLNDAWNETAAFVKREARLLVPVAFALAVLPMAVVRLLIPVPVPGQLPPAGLWLALVPLAILLGMIGNIAISHLALRSGRSVGEAIAVGARRVLPLLGAFLLLALALSLLVLVVATIGALLVPGIGPTPTPQAVGALLLVLLVLVGPVALYFAARLLLMTPVAAAEEGGTFALIGRSWALTRPHGLKLVGFILLVAILLIVVSLAVGAVFGLVSVALGGAAGAVLLVLVDVVLNTVIAVFLTTMIARIYAQLVPAGEAAVFD